MIRKDLYVFSKEAFLLCYWRRAWFSKVATDLPNFLADRSGSNISGTFAKFLYSWLDKGFIIAAVCSSLSLKGKSEAEAGVRQNEA